jgi:hypothetical protein
VRPVPIMQEKFKESVKGINNSKIKLGDYLKMSLKSTQLDEFRVKTEAASVNENYLDDLFSVRPKARVSRVPLMAHPEGKELERSSTKKGSMLALMVAAVILSSFPSDAYAARSGGRVAGGGFRSSGRTQSRTIPRAKAQTQSTPKTVINKGPTVIIQNGGGYGYRPFGFGGFGGVYGGYGGYGMGPFGYSYNPTLSIGLTIADALLQE